MALQPRAANPASQRFLPRPASAIAPSSGASKATATLASEFAKPSLEVLSVALTPALQYCLKNSGKNPAITVVAKAEFPQS